ncbi:HD domain-containing protein [Marinisporobacter balticus]|uniref:Putative nucleotidyltransferase with HDIG domain n=1 Tax=Marinisporobacter balticus TaxID=2018667 RepID=A0A4R2KKU6_9FIRM|nr:HD domain-containing protein [Marinisporobacter balticus]TCO73107.1 putative nucleotidyltransferase with HDIG domain [Marinisporobacter balticus]
MDRRKAVAMLNKYVTTPHIITHSYAVENVMRALARKLEPDSEDLWGMAGLLHDLDNDLVDWQTDMSLHGPKAIEVLKEEGFGNEAMYSAICAHNPANGSKIESIMDRALYAADPITGFIRAITLVYPDQKIKSVKVKSIIKRMKDTRFAAGANRQAMKSINHLGIEFSEFAELSLNAMVEIANEIGL